MAPALVLTKVYSDLDHEISKNEQFMAVYELTPSDSLPVAGEPVDLSAATLGATTVTSVQMCGKTAETTGNVWKYTPATKKAIPVWTAAAAKGALAKVDAAEDLRTDVQSILVVGIK